MKLISTPAALVVIGLIWLASASSAEAAKIVFLEDDSCSEPQQIHWVLGPAGIGTINIRLDLVSTGECEEVEVTARGPPVVVVVGSVVAEEESPADSRAVNRPDRSRRRTAPSRRRSIRATDPSELDDLPPSFTGDPGPLGNGNDTPGSGNDTPGIIGGSLGLLLMTYPLLSDDDFGPDDDAGPNEQSIAVVPEPGSMLLLGTGLGLAARRLRRR